MLIEKITQKYRKKASDETIIKRLMNGEEELYYYHEPAITVKLNQAIDWNFSKVPEGEKKELEEGDTFMFDGRPQVISIVDDDTIKLITSDTGPLALNRIVKEIINPELKMAFADISNIQAEMEFIDKSKMESIVKSDMAYEVVSYEQYKIIKTKLFPGRENILDPKCFMIKINICGNNIPFPSDFYLNKSGIFYDPDFFEEEQIPYIVTDIFNWMYKNIQVLGRHEFETEKAEREENEKRKALEEMISKLGSLNQGMSGQGCSGNCASCSNPCTNPKYTTTP
jgi:hypothetical protein